MPVQSQHGLSLHAIAGIILQRYADIGTCVDDTLVQDGNLTQGIVHTIVGTLLQLHATGNNLHRTLGHVIGTQRDDIGGSTLILTRHDELVLLGILFGYGLRRVIKLVEAIGICQICHTFLTQVVTQILTKGLCCRQEHTTIINGIALNKVELAIGVRLHIGIQPVESHYFQQRGAL